MTEEQAERMVLALDKIAKSLKKGIKINLDR